MKSRAHQTTVIACYIHDSCNREFDLVDAKGDTDRPDSNAWLIGNVVVKAMNCPGNKAVVHFGSDGGNEHDGTLRLVHNTIVTPYVSPVVHLSAAKIKVEFVNNIVWDAGRGQQGQTTVEFGKAAKDAVSGSCNWLSAGFAAGVKGLKLDKTHVAAPGENPQYESPLQVIHRSDSPRPALGACEYVAPK